MNGPRDVLGSKSAHARSGDGPVPDLPRDRSEGDRPVPTDTSQASGNHLIELSLAFFPCCKNLLLGGTKPCPNSTPDAPPCARPSFGLRIPDFGTCCPLSNAAITFVA